MSGEEPVTRQIIANPSVVAVLRAELTHQRRGLEESRRALVSTETFTEYGWRAPDGTEMWQQDHGTDGAWIPFDPKRVQFAIDVDASTEPADIARSLPDGFVVLARLVEVTTGEPSVVADARIERAKYDAELAVDRFREAERVAIAARLASEEAADRYRAVLEGSA